MFGPSGFFQNIGEDDSPMDISDLEVIHDSEDGFNVLYRVCKRGRFFVYKALKPEYKGNPLYEELLRKDFNIGFTLNHPNICQYYGMVDIPSVGNCIVMEWVDGCGLETLLSQGSLSSSLARKIICEICDGLAYMHRKQVVHRDLKPQNILVTYNGQNVKLIDFGLSDSDSYNVLKAPAGTRVYASPELLSGAPVDCRTDIWSLGMVMSEMGGYSHVVSRCLRRDRDKRFPSAETVRQAVLNSGRRSAVIWALVLFLTLFVAIAGVWVYDGAGFSRQDVRTTPQEQILEDAGETVVKEPSVVAVEEVKSDHVTPVLPQKKESIPPSDEIDSAVLDDLFQEAVERIN